MGPVKEENLRGLTLDFSHPQSKRLAIMRNSNDIHLASPDLASGLALTTPELEKQILQIDSNDELIGLTPSLISSVLPQQTPDIERQSFQSLQTPLFGPIKDILSSTTPLSTPSSTNPSLIKGPDPETTVLNTSIQCPIPSTINCNSVVIQGETKSTTDMETLVEDDMMQLNPKEKSNCDSSGNKKKDITKVNLLPTTIFAMGNDRYDYDFDDTKYVFKNHYKSQERNSLHMVGTKSRRVSSRSSTTSQNSNASSVRDSYSPIDMSDQDRMKVERKRERNRLAASKCRRRKTETIVQLQEQNAELHNRLVEKDKVIEEAYKVIERLKSSCSCQKMKKEY